MFSRSARSVHDLLGHPLFTGADDEDYTPSSSKGETRILPDAAGTPLRSWRSGGHRLRPLHDAAHRPIRLLVDEGAGEHLLGLSIFGDTLSDLPSTSHALGRPVHVDDAANRSPTPPSPTPSGHPRRVDDPSRLPPADAPAVRVFEQDGVLYTLENRRPYAFRQAGIEDIADLGGEL